MRVDRQKIPLYRDFDTVHGTVAELVFFRLYAWSCVYEMILQVLNIEIFSCGPLEQGIVKK